MPRRTQRLAALALGGCVLLGAGTLGWALSGAVEGGAQTRIETLFRAAGLGWAEIAVDGTRTRIGGMAPDSGAALAALNLVRQAGRHLVLQDAITIAGDAPFGQMPRTTRFALDILRDERGVALGGLAPSAAAHGALMRALAEQPSIGAPIDLARAAAGEIPADWAAMQRMAVVAARALLHGRVSLTPRTVAIAGLPRNVIGRAAIEREAEQLRQAGLTVTLDLVPPPSAADRPPIIVAEHGPRGLKLIDCKAPDSDSAMAVEAILAEWPTPDPAAPRWRCRGRGDGGDAASSGSWVAAARASLAALATAPAARLEIEGKGVRLLPGPDTVGQTFEAAVEILRDSLPPGFSLVALPVGAASATAEPQPRLWLRARRSGDGVILSGVAPDSATRSAVASYAAAQFGQNAITDDMTIDTDGTAPEGWRAAALAALDALHAVERGEALVRERNAYLWGTAVDTAAARAAHTALDGVEAQGWTRTTRVTMDLPARVAALRLGPQACVDLVAATVAEAPILFAPSSAEIEAESEATLDRLAEELDQCAPLTLEVGGHTDAQGSAAYNNRLSAARAEAVRAALLARGTGSVRLTATGYGPSQPIADNATEAGRALNRRIAFRALIPDDPVEPPSEPPVPRP